MGYHIKLGNKDDLRPYSVANEGRGVTRQSANPFSAKLNTSEEYGDLENWNEWVVDSWTSGIGHKNPAEGYLYGHADTRFPNQVLLPLGLDYPDTNEAIYGGNDYAPGDTTIDGTTITKMAVSFTSGSTGYGMGAAWVYLDAPTGTSITISLEADDGAGQPDGSELATGSGTITKYRPGPIWFRVSFNVNYVLTASTQYHLIVAGTGITVPNITPKSTEFGNYYASEWIPGYGFQFLISFVDSEYSWVDDVGDTMIDDAGDTLVFVGDSDDRITHFAKASGYLYSAHGLNVRYWDDASKVWVTVDTLATPVVSMISTGTEIHWSYTTGKSKVVPATNPATVTDYTDNCEILAIWKGLMYKSIGNDIYYSSTGNDSSWSGPFAAGPDNYSVRGIAGLGDHLYISTDEALYYLAPGNFIVGVVPWPTISSANGRNMTVWMNNLYIPLYEDLIQFSEGGGLLQVGLKRAEGLPQDLQGKVYHLYPTQYFLLATLEPSGTDKYGSIFAYNGEGWHGIAILPMNSYGGGMYVDAEAGELWFGGDYGLTARLKYPSNVLNPAKTSEEKLFARTGWLEYDWFYAGPVELLKDIESVFIFAEDASSSAYFKVYWQDDDSTDWELLGSFTGNSDEVRWTDYTPGSITRPETRRIRLGILMRTDDETTTPLLRAHRLKFHTNVTDRWQWSLSIEVHDDQAMPGAVDNEYTSAQMRTHLNSMIQSVKPIIYEDLDGTQYEVKVTAATVRPTRFVWEGNQRVVHWQHDLSIEQVTAGTYSG